MYGTRKTSPSMGKLKALSFVFLFGAFFSIFAGCATLNQQSNGDCFAKRIKQADIVVVGHCVGDQKTLKRKGTSGVWNELREFHFQVEEVMKGTVDSQNIPVRSEERRVGKECRSRWSPYH